MATTAEMNKLISNLDVDDSFTWLVPGLPVVAIFPNGPKKSCARLQQHIGHPSTTNAESDNLTLWIGHEAKSHKMLVTLTHRLKLGPRKNARRTGRLMFLILPSESLNVGCTELPYYAALEDSTLSTLLDIPSDIESASCPLLDISLRIEHVKSYVIMPNAKLKRALQPALLDLLRKFKTLSEVADFHIFANHDKASQISLEHVSTLLFKNKATIATPTVELQRLYPGQRDAGINVWEDQGWYEDGEEDPSKEQRVLDTSPPPPAYIPHAMLAHSHVSATHRDVGASKEPVRTNSEPFFSPMPSASPPPPEPSLSSNYTDDLLSIPKASSSSDHEAGQTIITTPRAANTGNTNSDCSGNSSHIELDASRISPRSFYLIPQSSSVATRAESHLSAVSSLILDTPTRKRSSSVIEGTVDQNSVRRRSAVCSKRMSSFMINHSNLPASSLPSTELQPSKRDTRFALTQPNKTPLIRSVVEASEAIHSTDLTTIPDDTLHVAYDVCMAQWLIQVWKLCRSAHYIFITDLLQLGVAASDKDAEIFHDRRVACTASLLEHCSRNAGFTASQPWTDSTTNESSSSDTILALISWIFILDPKSEMNQLSELLELKVLEQQLLSRMTLERGQYNDLLHQFTRRKADIVTRTCIRLGTEVLQRDGREIADRMIAEMKRRS